MAKTLTQYEYLDRDMLLKGVCEWIVKESPLVGALPMKAVQGNSYKYNVELTLPTVSWLSTGDQITENTGTVAQRTADIYTMIGDSDTDKFAIATNSTQNPEAADIAAKAKAMAYEFEQTFITGRTTTLSSTKQFKGLMQLLAEFDAETATTLSATNSQAIAVTATSGTALSMAFLDQLIDQIKPGKPDFLLMSKRARRKVNALARASGNQLMIMDAKLFGIPMEHYGTIPIYASDFVPDNLQDGAASALNIAAYTPATARAATFDNTIIFAVQTGEDKVCGLQAGQMKHEVIDPVEDYNVRRNRFVWYCGAAAFKKYSLACLFNFNPDE